MRKAKVTVPAVSTNLGPGVESLSLALALHVTATFVERSDTRLVIETVGEGSADLTPDCLHPVMYAAVRVFQRLEDAPLGLRLVVRNNIPLGAGLGAEAAMTVAGLVGANNLMDMALSRADLIAMGAEIVGRPDAVVAAMLGGLTLCGSGEQGVLHRRVEVGTIRVVVVVPQIAGGGAGAITAPEEVALADAVYNLGRLGLVVDALREGDFELLGRALDDRLLTPHVGKAIPGFEAAVKAAREAGAVGVSVCGRGPALLAFALYNHRRVASAMEAAFAVQGLAARSWTLAVDTQGVVVSAAETIPS